MRRRLRNRRDRRPNPRKRAEEVFAKLLGAADPDLRLWMAGKRESLIAVIDEKLSAKAKARASELGLGVAPRLAAGAEMTGPERDRPAHLPPPATLHGGPGGSLSNEELTLAYALWQFADDPQHPNADELTQAVSYTQDVTLEDAQIPAVLGQLEDLLSDVVFQRKLEGWARQGAGGVLQRDKAGDAVSLAKLREVTGWERIGAIYLFPASSAAVSQRSAGFFRLDEIDPIENTLTYTRWRLDGSQEQQHTDGWKKFQDDARLFGPTWPKQTFPGPELPNLIDLSREVRDPADRSRGVKRLLKAVAPSVKISLRGSGRGSSYVYGTAKGGTGADRANLKKVLYDIDLDTSFRADRDSFSGDTYSLLVTPEQLEVARGKPARKPRKLAEKKKPSGYRIATVSESIDRPEVGDLIVWPRTGSIEVVIVEGIRGGRIKVSRIGFSEQVRGIERPRVTGRGFLSKASGEYVTVPAEDFTMGNLYGGTRTVPKPVELVHHYLDATNVPGDRWKGRRILLRTSQGSFVIPPGQDLGGKGSVPVVSPPARDLATAMQQALGRAWSPDNDAKTSFSTREHGDVGSETPGRQDVQRARAAREQLQGHFPGIRFDIQTIDEWTYLIVEQDDPLERRIREALAAAFGQRDAERATLHAPGPYAHHKDHTVLLGGFPPESDWKKAAKALQAAGLNARYHHEAGSSYILVDPRGSVPVAEPLMRSGFTWQQNQSGKWAWFDAVGKQITGAYADVDQADYAFDAHGLNTQAARKDPELVHLSNELHDVAKKYEAALRATGRMQSGHAADRITSLRSMATRLLSGAATTADKRAASKASGDAKEAILDIEEELAKPKRAGPAKPAPPIARLVTGRWASATEIPMQTAIAAYRHTSHTPERRAVSARNEYAETVNNLFDNLLMKAADSKTRKEIKRQAALAEYNQLGNSATRGAGITKHIRKRMDAARNEAERLGGVGPPKAITVPAVIDEAVDYWKPRIRKAFLAMLDASSRTSSAMITGPAGRNQRSEAKRMGVYDKRREDYLGVLARARHQTEKRITAARTEAAGGEIGVTRNRLGQAIALQEQMKAANKAARKAGTPKPHPTYRLTNNNSLIKRLTAKVAKLEGIERAAARRQSDRAVESAFAVQPDERAVFHHAVDTGTLVFGDTRPIKDVLKQAGFRWSRNIDWPVGDGRGAWYIRGTRGNERPKTGLYTDVKRALTAAGFDRDVLDVTQETSDIM